MAAREDHLLDDPIEALLNDADAMLAPQPAWPTNPLSWPADASLLNMAMSYPPGAMPGYYNMPHFPLPFPGGPNPYALAPPGFQYLPTPIQEAPVVRRSMDGGTRREYLPEGEGHRNIERHPRRDAQYIRQQELDDARTHIQDLERVTQGLIEELETYRKRESLKATRGRSTSRTTRRRSSPSPRRVSSLPRRRAVSHNSRDEPSRRRNDSYSPPPNRTRTPSPVRRSARTPSPPRARSPPRTRPYERPRFAPPVSTHNRGTNSGSSPRFGSARPNGHNLASRISPAPPPYSATAPRANRTPHQGLNKARNVSSRALHGPWVSFEVKTVEDGKTLFNAAEHDDKALLYLDYCNSTLQAPDQIRTDGGQYIISRWNSFLVDNRGRRDYLRRINAVPFRPAGTRSRRPPHPIATATTDSPSTRLSPAHDVPIVISEPASSLAEDEPTISLGNSTPDMTQDHIMGETAPDAPMEDGEWDNLLPPAAPWLSTNGEASLPVSDVTHTTSDTVTPPQTPEDERVDYEDDTGDEGR
ncbi:hypothetical protein HWV62_30503 [Athelia sp. TMB]|nr:hypothetical protein HWV62_30503 [Athelia sp. TMB]